jgi:hypothetical protein
MKAMGEIEIRVSDRETGSPVAGAHVGVFLVVDDGAAESEPRASLVQGTSDGEGVCRIRADVADGERVKVLPVVRARGHAECKDWFGRARRTGRARPDDPVLTRGGRVRIDVALARGATIEGTVTDASGRPVAGAAIGLVLSMAQGCSWPHAFGVSRTAHWPPPCRTDEHGRFEWLSFPVGAAAEMGGRFVLLVEHDDFAPAMVQSVEALPAAEPGVIRAGVMLQTGCGLSGTVFLADGTPASGAVVTLTARQDPDQPVCVTFDKTATADAAGAFVVRGLQRTMHKLDVERTGCAAYSADVDLASGAAPSVVVRLTGGADLAGHVVGRDGAPVADTLVIVLVREASVMRQAQTDAQGSFRIAGLPTSGRAEIRCPFVQAETTADLPSPPLVLRAPATVDVSVRLVADETGEPLGTAGHVTAFGPGFSTILEPGDDGVFHRRGTPSGRYEFWADVPGRALATSAVDVPEQGLSAPAVIRVPRGGVVRGVARDASGRPLANVVVTAYGARPMHERRAVTGADGAYEVRGLGEWAYLVFTGDGLALHVRPVRPTGSAEVPVSADVVLGAGATVTGRVVRADGTPVVRARVTAAFADRPRLPGEMPSALTGDDGRFALAHVPEGEISVAAGAASARVAARHGGSATVDLTVA